VWGGETTDYMLKDAFNRKPKKEPERRPTLGGGSIPVPSSLPADQVPTHEFEPLDAEEASSGAETVVTTNQLAALTLQRLIDTYQPPDLSEMRPQAPEQLPIEASPIIFAAEPMRAQECELSNNVINDLYYIEGLLAKGGMGQVLLCQHLRREMKVVMKLMLREADSRDAAFQRFMQECKVTHKLKHPNLVKVLDYGILLEGFKPYLVMELVEGQSLRQILRKRFALVPADIAQVLVQACEGLYEVHGKGIIHRDLKPENLMLRGIPEAPDNVKILDFGIAQLQKDKRFDESGWAIGSIGYMSPEQVCGQPVDLRTDIYSVGLIFYEAITGKPPFKGRTPKETMAMHVKAPLVTPSQIVHCENRDLVDQICLKALAKDPNERYQNMKDLQRDLAKLMK